MEGNFVSRLIEEPFKRHTQARATEWAAKFGKKPDGAQDEKLAMLIRYEVTRRGAMGWWLDFFEPLGWTGANAAVAAALAVGIKATTDKAVARPALWTLAATTALMSSIQLLRIPTRFDAGLRSGVDAAIAMHAFEQREGGYWGNVVSHPGQAAGHSSSRAA